MINNMKSIRISPYLAVILSFLVGLLLGGLALCSPWAQTSGDWGNYVDEVFMATSALCVTGFDCYVDGIANHLTIWGQLVELFLIQIGGLGFITIVAFVVTLFRSNISFTDRYYVSQATSSTSVAHVIPFVRKLLLVTLSFELVGFLLALPAFINLYGAENWMAYFNSAFHAVSAFNNAGLDLFGNNTSFIREASPLLQSMSDWAYYYLLFVTMFLIVAGSLSHIALIEIFSFKKRPHQWTAHTKICLLMAGILIVAGTSILYLTNGIAKGGTGMSFVDSLFLSISSRTAGFTSYDINNLSVTGRVLDWILMFIGGGPLSTASGIKTTTVFIIFVTIYSYIRGRKVTAFNRAYSQSLIVKAMAVMITSLFIVIFGVVILAVLEYDQPYFSEEKAIYETISAFSNTGLSTGMPTQMSIGSKIVYTLLMFVGRLGPMTMFSVFSSNMFIDEDGKHVKYVEEDVMIG